MHFDQLQHFKQQQQQQHKSEILKSLIIELSCTARFSIKSILSLFSVYSNHVFFQYFFRFVYCKCTWIQFPFLQFLLILYIIIYFFPSFRFSFQLYVLSGLFPRYFRIFAVYALPCITYRSFHSLFCWSQNKIFQHLKSFRLIRQGR